MRLIEQRNGRVSAPARIFRGYALAWAAGQLAASFVIAYGDAYWHFDLVRYGAMVLSVWSPLIFALGFYAMRREMAGEPPDDFKDAVVPIIVLAFVAWSFWQLMHLNAPQVPKGFHIERVPH